MLVVWDCDLEPSQPLYVVPEKTKESGNPWARTHSRRSRRSNSCRESPRDECVGLVHVAGVTLVFSAARSLAGKHNSLTNNTDTTLPTISAC